MASDFSFDIESKVEYNLVEEAIANAEREVVNRFDFRGTNSGIKLDKKEGTLLLSSSEEYKVKALFDVLLNKLAKRGVPVKNFKPQKIESALGGRAKQIVKIQQGLPQDKAREIVKIIKENKFKVNSSIQAGSVRISSKSKNELQAVISFLKGKDFDVTLQFANYR